jgi:hypothetical protein
MTPSSPRPASSTSGLPRARKRRVKRGIVAGYIHDISPRHRSATPVALDVAAPVTGNVPAPALAAEPAVTAAPPAR